MTVPVKYMDYSATKLNFNVGVTENQIIAANANVVPTDLYDKTSAVGASKLGEDTIKVEIKKIYSDDSYTGVTSAITYNSVNKTAEQIAALTWGDVDTAPEVEAMMDTVDVPEGTVISETQLRQDITKANGLLDALRNKIQALANAQEPAVVATTQLAAVSTHNVVEDKVTAAAVGALLDGPVYDATTTKVKFSDQDPAAAKIVGLKESYTIAPNDTQIRNVDDLRKDLDVRDAVNNKRSVYVVDQYGVYMPTETTNLIFKATNIAENQAGYAENNFKASDNNTATMAINGAELGDTFDVVLSTADGKVSATTKITVGADDLAIVTSAAAGNRYAKELVVTLEAQRVAGLG